MSIRGAGSRPRRLAVYVVPLLCAAVALAALLWARGRTAAADGDAGGEAVAEDAAAAEGAETGSGDGAGASGSAPGAEGSGGAGSALDLDAAAEAAAGLADVPAAETSPGRFLDDLAAAAEAGSEPEVAVAWRDEEPLPKAAAAVLEAYRDGTPAELVTSGFLDLKGNVWGAVLRDGRGWVDIALVSAAADDASCEVRVVRLLPRGMEAEGED